MIWRKTKKRGMFHLFPEPPVSFCGKGNIEDADTEVETDDPPLDKTCDICKTGSVHGKLTFSAVKEIRKKLAEGVPRKTLVYQYGVQYDAIRNIELGLTWKR